MKKAIVLLSAILALHVGAALAGGDPARGKALAARCTCHASGDLDGEPASRLVDKMQAFKAGEGGVPAMARIMKHMPEQDMLDLAVYFSGK